MRDGIIRFVDLLLTLSFLLSSRSIHFNDTSLVGSQQLESLAYRQIIEQQVCDIKSDIKSRVLSNDDLDLKSATEVIEGSDDTIEDIKDIDIDIFD